MLVQNSRKLHPEFDLDEASRIYAAAQGDKDLEGEHITSPYDLYSVEVLRDRLALRVGAPVATDVFVFGRVKRLAENAPRSAACPIGR
jgi:hypothetical protein